MAIDWVAASTVATGFASVISLVAVAWQIRSLAKQTKASVESVQAVAHLHTFTAAQEIDRFFADRPELRSHFYGCLDKPGDQLECQRIDAAAELLLDQFMLTSTQVMHMSPELRLGWRNYVSHVLVRSPALRDFYERNKDWYTLIENDDPAHPILNPPSKPLKASRV